MHLPTADICKSKIQQTPTWTSFEISERPARYYASFDHETGSNPTARGEETEVSLLSSSILYHGCDWVRLYNRRRQYFKFGGDGWDNGRSSMLQTERQRLWLGARTTLGRYDKEEPATAHQQEGNTNIMKDLPMALKQNAVVFSAKTDETTSISNDSDEY
jgi:hypothetical protein